MPIEIRRARPDEVEELAEYTKRVHGDDYAFQASRFRHFIDHNFIILARDADQGTLVGRALFEAIEEPKFGAAIIWGFDVGEGYQGQGIGTKMLQTLIDEAKRYFQDHQKKLRFLYLFTRSDNEIAHHLYEKFGFKKGPTIGKMFTDGEPDEMVMIRDFRGMN